MPWVSWKVRLSCGLLVMVASGSFAGASELSAPPAAIGPVAIRPRVERLLEPVHPEPGPGAFEVRHVPQRDFTGSRFPTGLEIGGGSKHRMILFTFDDGPSRRTTLHLLDVLDDLGIKAVFFLETQSFGNGNPWEREHTEIVREIVRRGHMIGNHTETHRQLPLLRNGEIQAELALSERKIEWAVGRQPRLIRPPGGALSERVEGLLREDGYTSVLWAIYPGDLDVNTPEEVVRTFFRVLKRRERETGDRGGIVLMHDTQRRSIEALPRLVAALQRRNCALLSRGEELYDIVDDLGYFIPGYEPDETLDERQEDLRERVQQTCNTLALR